MTSHSRAAMAILAALSLGGLSSCSKPKPSASVDAAPTAATVNYPLAYFTERIAGDLVTVRFPEIEGDPAFWEPKAEDIATYQSADLILLNGANYAKWVAKVSLPQARLVNTSAALSEHLISLDGHVTHTHGPGAAHVHGDLAFTTWLDPQLAIQQAAAIRDALSTKWPQHQASFESGYQALSSDLRELDAQTRSAFETWGQRPLLGSHPVYQYLSHRYDLDLKSVHWEPDVAPDEAMWKELETLTANHPATVMLWEGEPLAETREKLASKGIQSIVFDPCGNRPETGDYLDVMKTNLTKLK